MSQTNKPLEVYLTPNERPYKPQYFTSPRLTTVSSTRSPSPIFNNKHELIAPKNQTSTKQPKQPKTWKVEKKNLLKQLEEAKKTSIKPWAARFLNLKKPLEDLKRENSKLARENQALRATMSCKSFNEDIKENYENLYELYSKTSQELQKQKEINLETERELTALRDSVSRIESKLGLDKEPQDWKVKYSELLSKYNHLASQYQSLVEEISNPCVSSIETEEVSSKQSTEETQVRSMNQSFDEFLEGTRNLYFKKKPSKDELVFFENTDKAIRHLLDNQ